MDIKENIDKEVLSTVASEMSVTEDLLIQIISSDVYNSAITTFSWLTGFLILIVFSTFIGYFQLKKSDGVDDHEFFGCVAFAVSGIAAFIVFLMLIVTVGFDSQIEALFNHEYAVVKEINEMYDEMQNPSEEVNE